MFLELAEKELIRMRDNMMLTISSDYLALNEWIDACKDKFGAEPSKELIQRYLDIYKEGK